MKRITVLLIISAAFFSACSSSKWVRTTVVKQRDFIVNLEQRQEEGIIIQQNYEHPYKLGLPDLEKLMGDLTYVEQIGLMNTDKQNPVFQAVEIDRLAPVLADTLAKADATQRIRFTSFNRGKALIFSVSRETEGVIFIESGKRLNIAFNFINSEIDPTETNVYPSSHSKVDPLKIKTSYATISPTDPYAELHKFESGEQSPMWVVADLEKLKEAINTEPVPIGEVKEEAPPAAAPESKSANTETEKTTPAQASENLLQQDIKDKLKYLKELLDEGLISEKDYNAKKMELLDKLN
ncbi:MAG: SHOCT domain-containing protein [Desulfobacteraceae bacterium]|nr:hypothetical protein [Desulfobacteraceae bacterium]MBC2755603.1 SHOCT domain-containing protein [Desulfobacteraceae bacterium]